MEQHAAHLLGKVRPWSLDVEAVVFTERLDQVEVVIVAPIPAAHRAAGERQMRMQHHALRIEELLDSEPIAPRAGTGGIVEGEELRLQRRHAVAAHGACMAAREYERSALGLVQKNELRETGRKSQRGLERLRQALRGIGPNPKAVDHRLDVVLLPRVERRQRLELVERSV